MEKSLCSRLEMWQKKLCSRKNFNLRLKPKYNKEIKELRLSQILHYCSQVEVNYKVIHTGL